MPDAIVGSGGRLTVPKEVREWLGLKRGDRVAFEFEEDSVRLEVVPRKRLKDLIGSLPATREYPGKDAEREATREYLARKRD